MPKTAKLFCVRLKGYGLKPKISRWILLNFIDWLSLLPDRSITFETKWYGLPKSDSFGVFYQKCQVFI